MVDCWSFNVREAEIDSAPSFAAGALPTPNHPKECPSSLSTQHSRGLLRFSHRTGTLLLASGLERYGRSSIIDHLTTTALGLALHCPLILLVLLASQILERCQPPAVSETGFLSESAAATAGVSRWHHPEASRAQAWHPGRPGQARGVDSLGLIIVLPNN